MKANMNEWMNVSAETKMSNATLHWQSVCVRSCKMYILCSHSNGATRLKVKITVANVYKNVFFIKILVAFLLLLLWVCDVLFCLNSLSLLFVCVCANCLQSASYALSIYCTHHYSYWMPSCDLYLSRWIVVICERKCSLLLTRALHLAVWCAHRVVRSILILKNI